MQFICEPCQKAADILRNVNVVSLAKAKRWHKKCPGGTQCACQHRV